ncbi:MAG: leucyl aminopeptidase [Pseudomonadota bacterium]
MTAPLTISFDASDTDAIAGIEGRLAVLVDPDAGLDMLARRVDRLTKKALSRVVGGKMFADLKPGKGMLLPYPVGVAAEAIAVVKLPKRADVHTARLAGATVAAMRGKEPMTVLAAAHPRAAEISYGLALRAYDFDAYRGQNGNGDAGPPPGVRFMVNKPEEVAEAASDMAALTEGVFFTRDLVNEPANVLTTNDFAARLAVMQELGLDVEVIEEAEMETLGMRALLAVGQGSASPSKLVVMRWNGGGEQAPLALIGKGVVFDTGGISLKPAGGMEDMTMDMGGAGVVAGVMRALALRRAKANVVGLVGLVENMPSSTAQRPGDVVRSMKGDTVEVINTDAEGRLVLCDVLWYAQDRFAPSAMIDLATLTGAIIIGLGHENAGVFANDDALADAFLKAAAAEREGAWRMPLGPGYDRALKSRIADMKNVGGRPAGAITAAQFLQRFVKDGTPWIHLDIAGVAALKEDTDFAPKGGTGWGVRTLDRLIRDRFEG